MNICNGTSSAEIAVSKATNKQKSVTFQTNLVRELVGAQAAAVSFAGKAGTDVIGVVVDRVCDTVAAS